MTFGLFTQVSDSGPQGPLVFWFEQKILLSSTVFHIFKIGPEKKYLCFGLPLSEAFSDLRLKIH